MNSNLSLNHFITYSAQSLIKTGVKNAKNEIIWYLESLQVCTREQIYLDEINLNDKLQNIIHKFCNQRVAGVPFQYILKKSTFYGRDFYINQHVLIPRPETELFISQLINKSFNHALEIGTGSGVLAITLSLEKISKKIIATDISSKALSVAKKNIAQFQLSNITLLKHDFLNERFNEKFNLIISNPPYITYKEYQSLSKEVKDYEPSIALTDKGNGLLFYSRFADILEDILLPQGVFLCELGSAALIPEIKFFFIRKGFKIQLLKDLNNDERILKIKF